MENLNSKKMSAGITLIALVVTIIVLLILAGISIMMLTGDNGILNRAGEAKINTDKAEIIEQANLDVLAQITDNRGSGITEEQLKTILKKYFNEQEVEDLEIPENVSTASDEITSKEGNYKIKLASIYNGKLGTSPAQAWTYNHQAQTVTNGKLTLNIGDYVNDTGTQTVSGFEGQWRVLGVEDGQLLLVTATYYAPFEEDANAGIEKAQVGPADYGLRLQGADGYNNGIERLNTIGATYNNAKLEKGRSIKVEDINKITGYNPNNIGVNDPEQSETGIPFGSGKISQYKNKVTYTLENGKVYYQGIDAVTTKTQCSSACCNFKPLGQTDNITSPYTINESTAYAYYPTTLTETEDTMASVGLSTDSAAYDMLFKTPYAPYYLASICVYAQEIGYVTWDFFCIPNGILARGEVWHSQNCSCSFTGGVRPVVLLKSNITPNLVTEGNATTPAVYEI